MATDTSALGALGSALGGTSSASSSTAAKKKSDSIDSNDFMNLLVAQLKNQDPLNPMDNQQFAVQLAQFSQLEQLVSINQKVGQKDSSTGDLSSLASYLGHEVVTTSSTVNVKNNDGGMIAFKLPSDSTNVQVQLIDGNGAVVESADAGPLAAGKQTVSLAGLATASGSYSVQVVANSSTGQTTLPAYTAGIVSGVIPGADPKLIVNGNEIGTGEISEVRLPS